MTEVTFRPRIAPMARDAVLMTLVVYFMLAVVGRSSGIPYPFGIAMLVGGANLGWNLLRARKHGVRADETGATDLFAGVSVRWNEITRIALDVEQIQAKQRKVTVRVATLESPSGTIRFADTGTGEPRIGTIVNVPSAGWLLGLATAKTGATPLSPPSWSSPDVAEPATHSPPVPPARQVQASKLGGVVAVAVKAGPKAFAVVVKLAKTIKLTSVALTIGAYALLVSWKFGIALVGMVLVHECGHVFAMWRSNVPVKGIYMIPFFGGAAVSQGIAKTRARTAYIAINGPIWGTLLAAACLGAFALTDEPFFGALAAWGALINLFNLLPIFPLDGGRIIASLAHASPRGVPIVGATLAIGAAVAYFAHLELLLVVGFLGLLEFGGRLSAATLAPMLALLGRERRFEAEEAEAFGHHVAYVELGRDSKSKVEQRASVHAQRVAEAQQTPMSFRQGAVVLAGYAALIGILLVLLHVTKTIAGSGDPLSLLR